MIGYADFVRIYPIEIWIKFITTMSGESLFMMTEKCLNI